MTRTPAEIATLIGQLDHFAKHAGCSRALNDVCREAADALAPLAAERGEVVAYRYDFPGGRCSTELGFEPLDDEMRMRGWIETPLYAHPPPPAPAAMPGVEGDSQTDADIPISEQNQSVEPISIPSLKAIEREIAPMSYAGADLTEAAQRILALFQPLAQENERLKVSVSSARAYSDLFEAKSNAAEARALSAQQALVEAGKGKRDE